MKKQIITITTVLILAFLFIAIFLNYTNRDFRKNNGFNRVFASAKTQIRSSIFLENEDYTFLKLTPEKITFFKFRKPSELLDLPIDLKTTRYYNVIPPSKISHPKGMNSVTVVGPDTFILAGSSGKAYHIGSNKPYLDSAGIDSISFAQSLAINANSFLITKRIPYRRSARRDLVVVNWEGKRKHSYMPDKQVDGYFCTDGQFRYNERAKQLIYMFYYRGQFICLDTNLNVKYKAKTIDTVKLANIFLKNTAGGRTVFAIPPRLVNRRFCVSGNLVYIQSNLKADNESNKDFDRSEVFDVYNFHDGNYLYSFYIPIFDKEKLYDFSICNNILVATYKNAIVVYKIPTVI